jgi:hypothetical protein
MSTGAWAAPTQVEVGWSDSTSTYPVAFPGADRETDATIKEIESYSSTLDHGEIPSGIGRPWRCLEWSEGESSVGLVSRRKIRLVLWPRADRENKNLGGERQATVKKPIERELSLGEEMTLVQGLEPRLKEAH